MSKEVLQAAIAVALFALVAIAAALRGRKARAARPARVRMPIGSHTLTASTPNGRIELPLPAPAGINPASAVMRLECAIQLYRYLESNPGGHFAIVLRADLGQISRAVWGHGAIGGSIYGRRACWYLESWLNGAALPSGQRHQIVFTEQRSADGTLRDGVTYRLVLESTIRAGQRYLRLQLTGDDGAAHDTGHVADPNVLFDAQNTALAFAHVFAGPGQDWAIQISNATVTWQSV